MGFRNFNPMFKDGAAARPRVAEYMWGSTSVGDVRPSISTPKTAINLREIYRLVERCSSLDKAIMTIRDYAFKDGVEWVPKYSLRCKQCNYEHPRLTRPVQCTKCNTPTEMEAPDEDERKKADSFFRRMDRNGNTLVDILRMFSWHLNVADDGYLLMPKEYNLDSKGNIVDWEPVRDCIVADPRNFRRVNDPQTGMLGGVWKVCLRDGHRPKRTLDPQTGMFKMSGQPVKDPGQATCMETFNGAPCGFRLYDVWFVSLDPTYSSEDPAEFYIADVEMEDGTILQEVINTQKFHMSYDGGRSPIVAIWHIANALCDQEKFMGTYYKEERMPRKMMFIPTGNFKGLESVFREAQNRNVSMNGHYFPAFPYDPGISSGPRQVQLLDLDPLPAELQYIMVREEFHRRVAMTYDITPAFHGGVEPVGGAAQVNPIGWQVTVLGVNKEQSIHNNKVIPAILQQIKCASWGLILREAEEDDLLKKFQVKLLESQNAMMRMQLGFMPMALDSSDHYVFPDSPQMMGGPNAPMAQGPQGAAGANNQFNEDEHRTAQGVGKPGTQGAEEDRGKAGLPRELA